MQKSKGKIHRPPPGFEKVNPTTQKAGLPNPSQLQSGSGQNTMRRTSNIDVNNEPRPRDRIELEQIKQREQQLLKTAEGNSLSTVADEELTSMFKLALDEGESQTRDSSNHSNQYRNSIAPTVVGYQSPGPMPAPPGFASNPPGMLSQQSLQANEPGRWTVHSPSPNMATGTQAAEASTQLNFGSAGPQKIQEDPYSFGRLNAGGNTRISDTCRMKGYEIFNIIRFQRSIGQTDDTYSDDFYFLKFREHEHILAVRSKSERDAQSLSKKSKNDTQVSRPSRLLLEMMKMHEEGLSSITTDDDHVDIGAPLPEMPGVKRLPKEFEVIRSKAAEDWHKTTSVLGKTAKSNLKTPRELIDFNLSDAMEEGSDGHEVFNSIEWKIRRLVADVATTILEIEDIHRLLRAKIKSFPSGEHYTDDVNQASKNVLNDLERQQVNLCDKLATLLGFSSLSEDEIKLDKQRLRAVLWMNKGRKLVCRSAGCLLPMHHEALMKAVAELAVYFVCTSPDGSDSDNPLRRERAEIDMYCADFMSSEIGTLPLEQIVQFLHIFLLQHNPESLRAVIATPGGAQLVRSILIHGQKLAEKKQSSNEIQQSWSREFEKFLQYAEEGIQKAQAAP